MPFPRIMEPLLTVADLDVRGMSSQTGKFLLDLVRHPNTQVQTYSQSTSKEALLLLKSPRKAA